MGGLRRALSGRPLRHARVRPVATCGRDVLAGRRPGRAARAPRARPGHARSASRSGAPLRWRRRSPARSSCRGSSSSRPACAGFEMSDETKAGWAEEEAALERGDVDAAVEVNLRMWVDGPSRSPDDVDPDVRRKVGEMQRRAIEIWLEAGEEGDHQALVEDWGRSARRDLCPDARPRRRARPARDARDRRPARDRDPERAPRDDRRHARTSRAWSAPDEFDRLVLEFLVVSSLEAIELVDRIWAHDSTVWTGTDEGHWLGWLDEPVAHARADRRAGGAPGATSSRSSCSGWAARASRPR